MSYSLLRTMFKMKKDNELRIPSSAVILSCRSLPASLTFEYNDSRMIYLIPEMNGLTASSSGLCYSILAKNYVLKHDLVAKYPMVSNMSSINLTIYISLPLRACIYVVSLNMWSNKLDESLVILSTLKPFHSLFSSEY